MEKFPQNLNNGKEISRRKFLKKSGILVGGTLLSGALSLFTSSCNEEKDKEAGNGSLEGRIDKAKQIIEDHEYEKFLDDPYIVSTLYYSNEYINKINAKEDKNPQENIINEISKSITPEIRTKYIEMLDNKILPYSRDLSKRQNTPLKKWDTGKNLNENHQDAIDLFTNEGAKIFSITSGIVVLSEGGWDKNRELSTSSVKGGNTIIIYNSLKKEFYRYAHLDQIKVKVGDIVTGKKVIATVGHTGENASKAGHGNHLHLEINKYDALAGNMRAIQVTDLKTRLDLMKNNL